METVSATQVELIPAPSFFSIAAMLAVSSAVGV